MCPKSVPKSVSKGLKVSNSFKKCPTLSNSQKRTKGYKKGVQKCPMVSKVSNSVQKCLKVSKSVLYSQVPNKRVYSISIFRFFPTLLALFPPYFICKFSTLLVYWALFSTLLIYLALLFYEIYSKYPPYSFIWPYSFNWHLRVYRMYIFIPIAEFWKK